MALETVGVNAVVNGQVGLFGAESWETDFYKEKYGAVVNGVSVFEIKPWEVVKGSVLILRDLQVLEQVGQAIPCRWNPKIGEDFADGELVVTDEIMLMIEENRNCIANFPRKEVGKEWYVSLAMFRFAEGSPRNGETIEKVEEVAELPVYSIKKAVDEEIIEEMKKKVDFKRFHKLIAIACSNRNEKYFPKKKVVEEMLDKWARAKYDYYLLFGRNLEIRQNVELPMSNDEMKGMVAELSCRFPRYGAYLSRIEGKDYVKNKLTYLPSVMEEFGGSFYTCGMKVSKFFSAFLEDEKFDIELSKIMQNKVVNGTMHISIDPYDYLTSSINKHGWQSCHRIADDGEYGNGSVSYMLDEASLVAFRANDAVHKYEYYGFEFEGNSKSFRQLVYMDKHSCSVIFSRQYPNGSDDLAKVIRGLLEDQIAEYLGIESKWKVYNEYQGRYTEGSDLPYHDVQHGFNYKFVKLTESKDNVAKFVVGENITCPRCGEEHVEQGGTLLCSDCLD